MCRDWTGDHEIRADEEDDVKGCVECGQKDCPGDCDPYAHLPFLRKYEPTDEELEEMNRVWQNAHRGCVGN